LLGLHGVAHLDQHLDHGHVLEVADVGHLMSTVARRAAGAAAGSGSAGQPPGPGLPAGAGAAAAGAGAAASAAQPTATSLA
jgi:hypothetical protein